MKEKLQKQLEKNRDEIDRLLHADIPLKLVYIRINMLSNLNKDLIRRIDNI
jgi:hypothetical protein